MSGKHKTEFIKIPAVQYFPKFEVIFTNTIELLELRQGRTDIKEKVI